jgi:hypothetical protein
MEPVTSLALEQFLQKLGSRAERPTALYLLGGSALCLLGSPRETLDVDYTLDPKSPDVEKLIAQVADESKLDLEFVPLAEFIPLPPESEQRRRFVGRYGQMDVFIFDLYSIALSKIARGFESDFDDVLFLLAKDLIGFDELERLFLLILPDAARSDILSSEFKAYFDEVRKRVGK